MAHLELKRRTFKIYEVFLKSSAQKRKRPRTQKILRFGLHPSRARAKALYLSKKKNAGPFKFFGLNLKIFLVQVRVAPLPKKKAYMSVF